MTYSEFLGRVAILVVIAGSTRPVHAQQVFAVASVRAGAAVSARDSVVRKDSLAQKDSTPPAPAAPSAPRNFGFTFSGYAETAFNSSNRASSANGQAITGRLYDRTGNDITFNAIKLTLDRPADATRFDVGFHGDMVVGENARMLKSAGFNAGENTDLYQFYGTVNIPTANGNGVQVKVGRMATFLGFEVIEAPLNPNVSIASQFSYVENFTQTGVSVEHRFNGVFDAQFRVLNGWDQVRDVNNRLSYMARLGITPNANSTLAFAAFTGPEQSANNRALRSGVEVLASRKIGKVTAWVQGDVGQEQRNDALPDPTRNATWWAAGSWLVIDATPKLGVALRTDYLSDRGGSRTASAFALSGAPDHRLASATGTLNIKAIPHVLLRPELRYDRSNQLVFNNTRNQVSLGLSAAYLF